MVGARREVRLRAERAGPDSRDLWAYLDADGDLHIDGQDLGPQAGVDGEYEWFQKIKAENLPQLLVLLGGKPGDDVLQLLEECWSGDRAGDLERLLRESGIAIELHVWS